MTAIKRPNSRDNFTFNHFVPPMIANGKVYVGTPNSVAVLGLLNQPSRSSDSIRGDDARFCQRVASAILRRLLN